MDKILNDILVAKEKDTLLEYEKVLNKSLPGPFTYILNASNQIPKLFDSKKKTVGIRIPDNKIVLEDWVLFGIPNSMS